MKIFLNIVFNLNKMKFHFGILHNSILYKVILFLILSTEHAIVKGSVLNLQSPASSYYDLQNIYDSTNLTPKLQQPTEDQEELYSTDRKREVAAAELESIYLELAFEPKKNNAPPIKSQPTLSEKDNTYDRDKRGLLRELRNSKPAEPLSVGKNLDEQRATSFFHSDFGRPEFFKIDKPTKSDPPQTSPRSNVRPTKSDIPYATPRPRKVANVDFRQLGSLSKETDRPQNVIRSQNHLQTPSKPQTVVNPILNKPIKPQINANFQSFDQKFIPHKEPHTNLRNSDVAFPIHSRNNPSNIFDQHSHPFHRLNTRPENTKPRVTSQFEIHNPEADHNSGFTRHNNRPEDSSSFSRFNSRPEKTRDHAPSQFRVHSRHNQNLGLSRPNIRPNEFSSFSTFDTRPEKTRNHEPSHFRLHSPHNEQNLALSRPNKRPQVDFSSYSSIDSRPENTIVHAPSQFDIHRPHTNQNFAFSRPNNRPHDFSSFSTLNSRPEETIEHTPSQFNIQRPHTDQNLAFSRPDDIPVDFSSLLDRPVSPAANLPGIHDDGIGNSHISQFTRPSGVGCKTPHGFRRPGEVWYSSGCRRSKCIAFRGHSYIETDQCDTEIYNTVYSCIVEVDIKARYPSCCPRYRCNPDNLGNLVDRVFE